MKPFTRYPHWGPAIICFYCALVTTCIGGFLQGLDVASGLRHAMGYTTVALWLIVIVLTIRGGSE